MSNLYKKAFRGYLIDHHSPDPPIITFENLNIDEYEDFIKQANINSLMLYCKDHWGVAYYDTKIGKKHPALKEDWVGNISSILKKRGIEFNAYYCLEYDNHACISHPEWRTLKKDASPLTCSYSKAMWKMPCYETGYREYALVQLEEIVENYEPDSLFLDIFGKSLCYCDSCKLKFFESFGYELPEDDSELKKSKKDVYDFLDDCAKSMLEEIIERLKKIDSTLKITINFAALYNKEIRDLLDYQFTEPWAGNFLSAAYARDTAIGQYPQLGPGDVSEVYNYKSDSIYDLAVAQIVANGCRAFIYSGSQHPDGTLEHTEAKKIGIAYENVKKFEDILSNRHTVKNIGIIQDDYSDKLLATDEVHANAIARVKAGGSHRRSLLGAMKLCNYMKTPWNIIVKGTINYNAIKDYKVLLIPSVYVIDNKIKSDLEKYVENGGILISDGTSSLYNNDGKKMENLSLDNLFGMKYIKEETFYEQNDWGAYLDLDSDKFSKKLTSTYPPVSNIRQKIKVTSGTGIGKFVNPATEITSDKWVNWWSPPPKDKTDDNAIVVNEYGRGQAVYFAYDMFNMENNGFNLNRKIFTEIIDFLDVRFPIHLDTDTKNILDIAIYETDDKKSLIIHEISNMANMAEGDIVSISGGKLVIDGNSYNVMNCKMIYPKMKNIDVTKNENSYEINLPNIDIHNVFQIDI